MSGASSRPEVSRTMDQRIIMGHLRSQNQQNSYFNNMDRLPASTRTHLAQITMQWEN